MAIGTVVTRGFSTGSLVGSIGLVVLRGYVSDGASASPLRAFRIVARQTYSAGATAADSYHAGATREQTFHAGAAVTDSN